MNEDRWHERMRRAREADADIEKAYSIVNHSRTWFRSENESEGEYRERFREMDSARHRLLDSHDMLKRAIDAARETGGDPIYAAHLDEIPLKLAGVREHPGITGKEANTVVVLLNRALEKLGGRYEDGGDGRVPSD